MLLLRRIITDPELIPSALAEIDGRASERAGGHLWLGVAGRRAPGRRVARTFVLAEQRGLDKLTFWCLHATIVQL